MGRWKPQPSRGFDQANVGLLVPLQHTNKTTDLSTGNHEHGRWCPAKFGGTKHQPRPIWSDVSHRTPSCAQLILSTEPLEKNGMGFSGPKVRHPWNWLDITPTPSTAYRNQNHRPDSWQHRCMPLGRTDFRTFCNPSLGHQDQSWFWELAGTQLSSMKSGSWERPRGSAESQTLNGRTVSSSNVQDFEPRHSTEHRRGRLQSPALALLEIGH